VVPLSTPARVITGPARLPQTPRGAGVALQGAPLSSTAGLPPITVTSGLAEATVVASASPVDRAASLRVGDDVSLRDPAVGPLWSGDSRSLLYLTSRHVDPRTGWWVGTLLRYGPSGTIRLNDLVRNYAWSPDSRSIVYTTQAPDAGTDGPLAQDLHVVRADGSGDRVLCRVDRASVEFLSSHVTAVRDGRLVTIDPSTGALAPLPHMPSLRLGAEDVAFWALSPGERFFAYQDQRGLRVWDLADGERLMANARVRFGEASFHFSWDGGQIFYSTFDGRRTMLYRQALAPLGAPHALNDGKPLHGPILQVGSPSPDGSILNFHTGRNNGTISYLIDARSGHAHQLLPPRAAGVGPVGSWSPDGTRMVFTIYRGAMPARSGIVRVLR
jgi:hypothetical protein